ncbi:hypothetical protein Tco_0212842 [Tanacetum coccineum]
MVEALMYLTASRPDIIHATSYCARYQARPTKKHLKEVKQIFWYKRRCCSPIPAKSDSSPHAHTQALKFDYSTLRLLLLNKNVIGQKAQVHLSNSETPIIRNFLHHQKISNVKQGIVLSGIVSLIPQHKYSIGRLLALMKKGVYKLQDKYEHSIKQHRVDQKSNLDDSSHGDDARDTFQNDPEDTLNSIMMLLACAITQHYSTPTNNRLRSSSNIRNQAVRASDKVKIQNRIVGNDGRIARRSYSTQEESVKGSNVQKETRNVTPYQGGNARCNILINIT